MERSERVFCQDLGKYLDVGTHRIKKWARKYDYLRRMPITGLHYLAWYVSVHAARQCILHFRALQGEMVLKGTKRTDPWFNKEWDTITNARRREAALRKVKKAEEP